MRTSIISIFLILLYTASANGQDYEVLETKRSFKQNGDKIRTGDFLDKYEIVLIKEKGHLTLDVESPIHLKLAAGKHNIDSLSNLLAVRYKKHNSLMNILENRGLLECKFKYKVWVVPGTNRHYEADRIKVLEEDILPIQGSDEPITLNWENPDKKYHGNYLLTIQDAFSKGFIAILETDEQSISFYPGKYGHQYMLYRVIAEDCRASRIYNIKVKH